MYMKVGFLKFSSVKKTVSLVLARLCYHYSLVVNKFLYTNNKHCMLMKAFYFQYSKSFV